MREASGERGVATRPGSALTRFSRLDVSKKLGRFWWRLLCRHNLYSVDPVAGGGSRESGGNGPFVCG